jgi:hypothetical protein
VTYTSEDRVEGVEVTSEKAAQVVYSKSKQKVNDGVDL